MIENDVQPEVGELETYHIYPMQGRFFITREEPETVVDSTPPVKAQPRDHHGAIMMLITSFVMALFVILTPNTPITQQITLVHSFAIPKDIQSFTLPSASRTQIRTIPTTGRGHQDALLPAANPPLFGQVSVPAHALHVGIKGNIPSYAVDDPCCATSVKVVNRDFTGGRDARNFPVVARKDIEG